jgi:hypothetical protein
MDNKTTEEINKITRSLPRELERKLMKTEVDRTDEELAKMAIKNSSTGRDGIWLSEDKRRHLQKLVDSGALRHEEKVVDEKVVKEIDQYYSTKIRQAQQRGKLSPAAKDRYLRERAYKINQHK